MYGERLHLSVDGASALLDIVRLFEMIFLERRVWDHLIAIANEVNARIHVDQAQASLLCSPCPGWAGTAVVFRKIVRCFMLSAKSLTASLCE